MVSCYKTNIKFLKETLNSLENQVYENNEICIEDDFSESYYIKGILLEFGDNLNKQTLNKEKIKFLRKNLGINWASNEAISLADGDYIVLGDHDDILPRYALWTLAYYMNKYIDLLYSDEDKIDQNGMRYDPY